MKKDSILILHNIRSTHNVGSLFRTADAAGISHIYLVGYTPDPIDKYGRDRTDISKASLGAEKTIPWTHADDIEALLKALKEEQFQLIAIEQSEHSTDYKKITTADKVAFILGPEVEGIDPDILKLCDHVAEIPMMGEKESLNVSVAAGIAIFRILNI